MVMRMNLYNIYHEKEFALVTIRIRLILVEIKLALVLIEIKLAIVFVGVTLDS